MSEDFPLLFLPLAPRQAPAAARPRGARADACAFFAASIAGVRSHFAYLSEEDIVAPPHRWFDAHLARQIAVHLTVTQFGIPKRALAEELARSRHAVTVAMRAVEERLQYPEFQDAYGAMADEAARALETQGGDVDE